MKHRTALSVLLALVALPASAQERPEVVASFSILADIAANVAGDDADVTMLVGPDADAHVFEPSPADAQAVAAADLVIVNGLGFEGWMERLLDASGYDGPVVVASDRVAAVGEPDDHGHEDAGDADAGHGGMDPHAWNDPVNGEIYARNIADGLAAVDPAHAAAYHARAEAYAGELASLDADIRARFRTIPAEDRRVLSSHDAFGYFARAFGVDFISPQGWNTDSEPSAQDVARIIDQVRAAEVRALFVENITNERLVRQIAGDTGVPVGGTLYSDALSGPGGPAGTYLDLLRHNAGAIADALGAGS